MIRTIARWPSVYRTLIGLTTLIFAAFPLGAAPRYSEWSAPQNLGPTVNSPFSELGPAISKDGLSLYFASNRPGGSGAFDIWVSQPRSTPHGSRR